jgi:hypothetical protein
MFHVAEILFTFTARNLLGQASFPKPSSGHLLLFEGNARKAEQNSIWNEMCSLTDPLGSKSEPLKARDTTDSKEARGASPLHYLKPLDTKRLGIL